MAMLHWFLLSVYGWMTAGCLTFIAFCVFDIREVRSNISEELGASLVGGSLLGILFWILFVVAWPGWIYVSTVNRMR